MANCNKNRRNRRLSSHHFRPRSSYLPDQSLVLLNYPRTGRLFTKEEIDCIYFSANDLSAPPLFKQPPLDMDGEDPYNQIIRCPLQSGDGFRVSVGFKK
ncbi:hypothetical protein RchiOBHm_Chr2g0174091 [Rosa chinensis]|uniref:Uncharacterized protein n=1 Tax=Rosa chinensis TaxID=74649 RepID=A0A2P6S625_ROSCH|nr:hypothetical protein RchiOBHm_Chr2g0174091 [Rosa chinensis]